jgi:hypothetical protein
MRILKSILIFLFSLVALGLIGFVIWALTPLGPTSEALNALESSAYVRVTTEDWIVFEPQGYQPDTGLIIYPGGRVDPRSYAPVAHLIAIHGFRVIILPMPLNLAVFGSNRASEVISAYPDVEHWALAGHSLGGAMSANFIHRNPDQTQGLVLWAAYPADSDDLSGNNLHVVSIYGNRDGLVDLTTIQASAALLPENTIWVEIQGGNHAQFGDYGDQPGDLQATINREEQQRQIVEATLDLLSELGGDIVPATPVITSFLSRPVYLPL